MGRRKRNLLELGAALIAIFVNGFCLVICLLLYVVSGLGDIIGIPLPLGGLSLGSAAPDFELATLQGGTFHLSDHLGQPVVVSFGTTW
jgi:hypothetical protein